MSIKFIENLSDSWKEITQTITNPHPSWPNPIPQGAPPSRGQGSPVPDNHELRPGERYYWVEGELPAPPPDDSPLWAGVKEFLLAQVSKDRLPSKWEPLNDFTSNVWKDRAPGDLELTSAGAWSQEFTTLYWNPPWAQVCPEYRKVGWEPWANGHPGGNHYCSATWALEEYINTKNPLSWQLFCVRVLHLAGQGVDQRYGGIRYEKSRWCFAGDFQADGYFLWSHQWPEAVLLFNHLTGELQDVVDLLVTYGHQNPHNWNGYWGIRGSGWYLRALRCFYVLTRQESVKNYALSYIDTILTTTESFGFPYFPNFGRYDSGSSPWQGWLFMSEALMLDFTVSRLTGNSGIYDRLKPMLDWYLVNTRFSNGSIAYDWTPANGARYLSFIHTSYAIPALAYMAEKGDLPWAEVEKSIDWVILAPGIHNQGLPEANGHSGLLWLDSAGRQTRPWGPAAPKIAANAMYGLRPTLLWRTQQGG